MIIPPMLARIGVAHPLIGNARAANETDFSIDDQQFAVAAIVVAARIGPERAVISYNLDPGAAQPFLILAPHFARPLSIENGMHFYTASRAFGQGLTELARDLPVPKDIGLEIDGMFGGTNRP